MQCSMAWALHRTEKEKPAAGKTDYWRDFWRSGWDSNPRNLAVQLISSQSRYDHFDTAPYLSQHQHLRKRGELMGRTSKNIKLRIPEKPRKIKGFRTGSYRVATTISSAPRYGRFATSPIIQVLLLETPVLLYPIFPCLSSTIFVFIQYFYSEMLSPCVICSDISFAISRIRKI